MSENQQKDKLSLLERIEKSLHYHTIVAFFGLSKLASLVHSSDEQYVNEGYPPSKLAKRVEYGTKRNTFNAIFLSLLEEDGVRLEYKVSDLKVVGANQKSDADNEIYPILNSQGQHIFSLSINKKTNIYTSFSSTISDKLQKLKYFISDRSLAEISNKRTDSKYNLESFSDEIVLEDGKYPQSHPIHSNIKEKERIGKIKQKFTWIPLFILEATGGKLGLEGDKDASADWQILDPIEAVSLYGRDQEKQVFFIKPANGKKALFAIAVNKSALWKENKENDKDCFDISKAILSQLKYVVSDRELAEIANVYLKKDYNLNKFSAEIPQPPQKAEEYFKSQQNFLFEFAKSQFHLFREFVGFKYRHVDRVGRAAAIAMRVMNDFVKEEGNGYSEVIWNYSTLNAALNLLAGDVHDVGRIYLLRELLLKPEERLPEINRLMQGIDELADILTENVCKKIEEINKLETEQQLAETQKLKDKAGKIADIYLMPEGNTEEKKSKNKELNDFKLKIAIGYITQNYFDANALDHDSRSAIKQSYDFLMEVGGINEKRRGEDTYKKLVKTVFDSFTVDHIRIGEMISRSPLLEGLRQSFFHHVHAKNSLPHYLDTSFDFTKSQMSLYHHALEIVDNLDVHMINNAKFVGGQEYRFGSGAIMFLLAGADSQMHSAQQTFAVPDANEESGFRSFKRETLLPQVLRLMYDSGAIENLISEFYGSGDFLKSLKKEDLQHIIDEDGNLKFNLDVSSKDGQEHSFDIVQNLSDRDHSSKFLGKNESQQFYDQFSLIGKNPKQKEEILNKFSVNREVSLRLRSDFKNCLKSLTDEEGNLLYGDVKIEEMMNFAKVLHANMNCYPDDEWKNKQREQNKQLRQSNDLGEYVTKQISSLPKFSKEELQELLAKKTNWTSRSEKHSKGDKKRFKEYIMRITENREGFPKNIMEAGDVSIARKKGNGYHRNGNGAFYTPA